MRIFRKLAQLLDVDLTSTPPADGDALTFDTASSKWVPGAGGGGGAPTTADYLVGTADAGLSAEIVVGTSPGGELGGTWASPTVDTVHSGSSHATVQAAAEATAASALSTHSSDTTGVHGIADTSALLDTGDIGSTVEAHDADLTTISGLSPTNDDVLQRKAGAWANRTIAQLLTDLALPGTTFQPLDSDLSAIAALSTTAFGRAFLALADEAAFKAAVNLEAGTDFPSQATFNDHSARHENGGADEISIAGLDGTPTELTNHLNDTTDAHDASAISVLDTAANFTGTDVEAVLAELQDNIGAGGGGSFDPDIHLPWRIEIHPWSIRSSQSGTWSIESFALNDRLYQGDLNNGGNNTDYLEWPIILSAGTWSFQILGVKYTNGAITTVSIDGTTVGTFDQYAGSALLDQIQTITGITVATAGKKLLRLATATKNASSSSFVGRYQNISLVRTA